MSEAVTKSCQFCGKEFTTNALNKKYCSDECRIRANRKQTSEWRRKQKGETWKSIGTRVCAMCGKVFELKNHNMVTCSAECKNKRRKLLYEEKRKEQMAKKKKSARLEPTWKINEKARAMGMSYGKYQLMMQMEAQRRERQHGY